MQPYLTMFDYVTRARERLFEWIRPLGPEQYAREFPYALQTIHATLLHAASAEWTYGRRLRGQTVVFGESPFTAEKIKTFAEAENAWRTLSSETRAVLSGITNWDAPIEYRIFPQGPNSPAVRIRATASGVVAQLVFHEVHHRSQVMTMLKQLGVAAQNLDYSALMFAGEQEPA